MRWVLFVVLVGCSQQKPEAPPPHYYHPEPRPSPPTAQPAGWQLKSVRSSKMVCWSCDGVVQTSDDFESGLGAGGAGGQAP